MAEPEDKPPVTGEEAWGHQASISAGHHDKDDVPQLEAHDEEAEVELQDVGAQTARHQAMEDLRDDTSELSSLGPSSADALPRRVDSPADSMLSDGREDPPSRRVCTLLKFIHRPVS